MPGFNPKRDYETYKASKNAKGYWDVKHTFNTRSKVIATNLSELEATSLTTRLNRKLEFGGI